jgi:hypothetical protein
MKLENKKKCTVLDGTGMLIVNVIVVLLTVKKFIHESRRDFLASTKLPGSPPTCIMENYASFRVSEAMCGLDQRVPSR